MTTWFDDCAGDDCAGIATPLAEGVIVLVHASVGYPLVQEWHIRRFEEIDSTNRWLLDAARTSAARPSGDGPAGDGQGAPTGMVAVADHQSAGRGRLGRAWVAPPGASLLCSILLRPATLAVDRLHLLTAAVALAAADAVEAEAGFRPDLKWPNDLMVGRRKLAGVLAEAALPVVVVGIGINCNWPAVEEMPPELTNIAVAANHIAGRPVSRDAVLTGMLAALGVLLDEGWDKVASRYRRSCTTIGQIVRVDLADESFSGTAADITTEGHLLVDVGTCLRTVTAADVTHLRPEPP